MHFRVSVIDSFFAMVRKYPGLSCDRRSNREDEAVDQHSETNSVHSHPQNKRRKLQASLFVNSKYVNKIIDWLSNVEITTIGIHGMGGVGKTTLAKQLETQLRNHDMLCGDIHAIGWVSVGTDFTIYQLQQKIASAFGLGLEGDKDETRRAGMIYGFLSRTDKCILVLDDLWEDFRREDVGIPRQCKMIVISRSLDVCRILRCQKVVKVEPLSEEESWQLFQHNIEYGVLDSKEVSSLRKLVYDECAGLPLAIVVLADSIRGEVNACGWKEFLKNVDPFPMGPRTQLEGMISQLKLSYDKLNTTKLQRCFLYAALYPKGYAISKEELIHLWMGEGLIGDVESLQAQYDMGHSILNKLINSCLLETCLDKSRVKMHDLVRRMALSIAGEKFMLKASVPSNLDFCDNLHAISMIKHSIPLIPLDTSLKLSNLSTLLMQHNSLEVIPDSFFVHMRGLRVLSLSHTCIVRLPSSISDLEELQVLDLNTCKKLKQVPMLAKLHKLRFLDLSQTALEQVPRSIEMLKGLMELNLSSIPEQKKFPKGVLGVLPRLKRLSCHALGINHELQKLKSLESLDAKFENLFDLSSYVRSQHWRTLECFHLQVGHQIKLKRPHSRGVSLQGCSLINREEHILLPFDIRELYLDDCSGFHSLSDVINPTNACGFKQRSQAFSSLEVCTISRCHEVEKLVSPGWMPNLQCLELLEVEECAQLKQLIVEEVEDHCHYDKKHTAIKLPQLKQLVLTSLPQLNSICKGQLVCASFQSLTVMDCPNLKHLSFSNMHNGEVLVPSNLECIEGQQKWWDLLEWDKMKSKALLQPFFRCRSLMDADG